MQALICVLPGDGIGPEVVAAAVEVLARIARRSGHVFHFEEAPIGGAAIDRRGTALPPETLALARRADAVLLGAVGGPRWDDARERPEAGLLRDPQGARPLRERTTGGAPAGARATLAPSAGGAPRSGPGLRPRAPRRSLFWRARPRASQRLRFMRLHGGGGRSRRRRRLRARAEATVAGHVDRQGQRSFAPSRLWREVVTRLQRGAYPDVTLDHELVMAAAPRCTSSVVPRTTTISHRDREHVRRHPQRRGAALLAGSIGLLPSASIGEGRSRSLRADSRPGPRRTSPGAVSRIPAARSRAPRCSSATFLGLGRRGGGGGTRGRTCSRRRPPHAGSGRHRDPRGPIADAVLSCAWSEYAARSSPGRLGASPCRARRAGVV